jgi:signal peptidase I
MMVPIVLFRPSGDGWLMRATSGAFRFCLSGLRHPFDLDGNPVLRGDKLFVGSWPKPQPKRDDIWAFRYPLNRREVYLKRIVGIQGDPIRLLNKVVYRNGAPLTEPYAKHEAYIDAYRDNFRTAG